MSTQRKDLSRSSRIVIKIGSAALALAPDLPARIAQQIADCAGPKRRFILVSSGAIALGIKRLGYRRRPREMAKLQAAAAAGQGELVQRYSQALEAHGYASAQVLLTHADLADRLRVNNARQALAALLEAKAIPIINENDTVATDEIRFGDNDQLASMVVPLVGSELLLLLTDVEGVLDAHGKRIALMNGEAEVSIVGKGQGSLGSGGIHSKIDAARKASQSGASVVVARASEDNVVSRILEGDDVGTLFPPHGTILRARKHWIAYTLKPRGAVLLDAGAADALRSGRASLLPIGVLGVRGDFRPGDAVQLITPEGTEVGRGLARLSALEIARMAGKSGRELSALSPAAPAPVIVHRDDLVLSS